MMITVDCDNRVTMCLLAVMRLIAADKIRDTAQAERSAAQAPKRFPKRTRVGKDDAKAALEPLIENPVILTILPVYLWSIYANLVPATSEQIFLLTSHQKSLRFRAAAHGEAYYRCCCSSERGEAPPCIDRETFALEERRCFLMATVPKWSFNTENGTTTGRLFFLDVGAGRVLSANPDGSDLQTLIDEGRKLPDGLVVDAPAGHIYWTNMGNPKKNDGSIVRSDLDGKNLTSIVPPGGTFTPKQLQLERKSGKIYWSDREGMRVMRASLNGSNIETLVDTSQGDERPGRDATKWCVGIAVDVDGGKIYWTQKGDDNAGQGRICRADIDLGPGESPADRDDIELLYESLPEPIDLDIDPSSRMLYWTDRGDPPRGNTVNRAPLETEHGKRREPEILFTHLMEGIGLALDLRGGRMFITDFAGSVYSANLDGSNKKTLLYARGNLTGIAFAELPITPQPH
jgi:hypothetical protein